MLHELLLALNGYTGSIFVKGQNDEIRVVERLPFIHPAEETQLNRLCQLATHYSYFMHFIRTHGHSPVAKAINVDELHGLYIKALCEGLDHVLDTYREALLAVEKKLLADPHLTVAYVQSELQEFQDLFPALTSVLKHISHQKIHGCYVLEILYKASVNGMPIVKRTMQLLLHYCHSVFYKQLSAWMLHGMLLDNYKEFFIQPVHKVLPPSGLSQLEDDDLGIGGITGHQLQHIMQLRDNAPSSPVYVRFGICAEKLPSYIPTRVAEKILFVGESVHMFEEDMKDAYGYKGSILKKEGEQFAKELHKLSREEHFHLISFEDMVDHIRSYIAEKLWKLIMEEANLPGHLGIMKDFFLLGRGELYQAFIDQAQSLLRQVPTGTTEHDINMAFQHAARNVLFEDEKLLQRFRLTVLSPGEVKKEAKSQHTKRGSSSDISNITTESGWNLLKLNYTVEWPLHILFTPSVLDRYNSLLHFLLYVKRIQLELHQCWALQMQRKHIKQLDPSKWWLRSHMAFLVDNLQYYLQVDVIESQFSVLLQKIETTRDFEAIQLAHDQFLNSLLSQSFLQMKPIAHCLNEILELCQSLCGLVSQSEVSLTAKEHIILEEITKNFQRQSNLLFRILSSVRSHQASPHLAQLLLRIDYNKYFTLAGGQLGSYQIIAGRESDVSPSSHRE